MVRYKTKGSDQGRLRDRLSALGVGFVSAGLIVAAGGGWPFLRKPVGTAYLLLWLGWWMILALGRRRGARSAYNRRQRLIVAFGGLVLVGLILGPPWEYAHLTGPLPRDGAIAWAGLTLFGVGIVLQVAAFRALGRLFTTRLSIQPAHRLVTDGPYRWVRHPAYLGYLLTLTGQSLAMSSLIGLALTALVVPLLLRRIDDEESMLASTFAGVYDAYRQQTPWRLLPWFY